MRQPQRRASCKGADSRTPFIVGRAPVPRPWDFHRLRRPYLLPILSVPLPRQTPSTQTHTIPLDLLFATDPQSQSTLARRRPLHLLDISLWVCSPEDLILLKLKASRPHDFEDALGIVSNPHLELEFDYLWKWADRLGLQGELHYVLKAAGR